MVRLLFSRYNSKSKFVIVMAIPYWAQFLDVCWAVGDSDVWCGLRFRLNLPFQRLAVIYLWFLRKISGNHRNSSVFNHHIAKCTVEIFFPEVCRADTARLWWFPVFSPSGNHPLPTFFFSNWGKTEKKTICLSSALHKVYCLFTKALFNF